MTAEATKPVVVYTESGVWSNTLTHSVYYSPRAHRFLKGRPRRGEWIIIYTVTPGEYIFFWMSGYKDERGIDFDIARIRIKPDGTEEFADYIISLRDVFSLGEFLDLVNDPNCPEALRDFIESVPLGYHDVGRTPDPTKTYPPDEIERVKAYLERKVRELAEG